MKREPVRLTRSQFYDLHTRIIEAKVKWKNEHDRDANNLPQPNSVEKELAKPDYELYGYDRLLSEAQKIYLDRSIKGIMEKVLQAMSPRKWKKVTIDGRKLRNYVRDYYNRGGDIIEIDAKYFDYYLTFISLVFGFQVLKDDLGKDIDPIPLQIKPKPLHAEPRNSLQKEKSHSLLKNNLLVYHQYVVDFCEHPRWFLYMYNYDNDKLKKIRRLLLQIEKYEQNYQIKLSHIVGRTSYTGKIIMATERNLTIELSGSKEDAKILYLMLTVEGGKSEIHPGLYLKKDNLSKIYSGSVILQKVPEGGNLTPGDFRYGHPEIKEVPLAIRKFFKHKPFVFTKIPKKFDLHNLNKWVDEKWKERNEFKIYDLYISAPVLGVENKLTAYTTLKSDIVKSMSSFIVENEYPLAKSPDFDKLVNDVDRILKRAMLGEDATATENLHTKFNNRIMGISEKLEDEGYKVYYSRTTRHKRITQETTPEKVFTEELGRLMHSRAFVLISIYDEIFSSCWIMIGTAIALTLPTFIISIGKKNLPYILRGHNYNSDIMKIDVSSIEELNRVPGMILNSDLWKKVLAEKASETES